MIRYHVTHKSNLPSIATEGLSPSYATGQRKAVWHVARSRVLWALAHCAARHSWPVADLVVLRLRMPSPYITKHGGGLAYSMARIPWSMVESHTSAMQFILDPADA